MGSTVRELLRSDLARIGMTQEQFGERLGISQQAISQWYKRNTIPLAKQRAVVDVLGQNSGIAQAIARDELGPVSLPHVVREPGAMPYIARRDATRPILENKPHAILEERQARWRDLYDTLAAELPASEYVERALQCGPITKRFDYASPVLVAEILDTHRATQSPGIPPSLAARRVLDLAVARKLYPERDAFLVIVLDAPAPDFNYPDTDPARLEATNRFLQRITYEASLFDVTVYAVRSMTAAGRLIADYQNQVGEADEPDDGLVEEGHDDLTQ